MKLQYVEVIKYLTNTNAANYDILHDVSYTKRIYDD